MAIHTDIPTRAQIDDLLLTRSPGSISIYLPVGRSVAERRADRTRLATLIDEAIEEARGVGAWGRGDEAEFTDALRAVVDDEEFWERQADTLAVFADLDGIRTFRLPNRLTELVAVSDRFHVKPLMRSVTFPQAAHLLVLAAGSVRLLEIAPDIPPVEIRLDELPRDAWDPRSNKVVMARERNYVRQIEHAVRGVVNGSGLPLILAATETIAAAYRRVNTAPGLVVDRIAGNPEESTDAELAASARTILDDVYRRQLSELVDLFDERIPQGRVAIDVAEIAVLATRGAVDTLVFDMDAHVPGQVDEESGEVTFAGADDISTYGVIDEIARRVHLMNGRVLAVRADDVPGGGPVAAVLRYAPVSGATTRQP